MKYSIKNKTGEQKSDILTLMHKFMPYAYSQLEYDKPVRVFLLSDPENASKPLGKTAMYNPDTFTISIYTDNRHVKDILRSLSHELVHHVQNCRGDFDNIQGIEEDYIQSDPHLRKMEAEAYLLGNGFLVRFFEEHMRNQPIMESEEKKEKVIEQPKEEESGNVGTGYNRKRKQVIADELMKRWIKK